jgi:hypothetical protein
MWQAESRGLTEAEIGLMDSLKLSLGDENLSKVRVRKFNVDNSHTLRSVEAFDRKLKLSKESEMADVDGATLQVLYFEDQDGSFGELEITRLDTKPLMLKWD